jgi:hypothetical protein
VPRREARSTGLQVEGPHVHGCCKVPGAFGLEWKQTEIGSKE